MQNIYNRAFYRELACLHKIQERRAPENYFVNLTFTSNVEKQAALMSEGAKKARGPHDRKPVGISPAQI